MEIGRRLAALLLVAAAASAGCGEQDEDQRTAVRDAFADLSGALARDDLASACVSMTPAAANHIGSLAHGSPRGCERDLRRLFRLTRRTDPASRRRLRLVRLTVDGDTAKVLAANGEGWTAALPFVRVEGEWKANRLFAVTGPPVNH